MTGTVDIAVTGRDMPTQVGTAGPDTLSTSGEYRPERLLGLDGNDTLRIVANGLVGATTYAFAGRGDDTIQVGRGGFKSVVFGGPGTNTVTLDPVSASTTIVLQQRGVDEITGFDPSKNDVLNLGQALAESQLNLGGDFGKLGAYVAVTDSGGNATLSFNSQGLASGPGSPLAVLHGVGPGITLATLISDHALKIT